MAKLTQQEKLSRALVALGFTEARATTHYRVFKCEGQPTFYVGQAGALRFSRTHRVTVTASASQQMRENVLNGVMPFARL